MRKVCRVLSGSVRWLRLHLRRVRTYIAAPQDGRLPGQYILGSDNCWTPAVHSSLVPFPACEAADVQPGESSPRHPRERWNMDRSLINTLPRVLFLQAGAIVTVLMLLIFYTSTIFLFVGTCLCGLFLSSIFPCMLAYTEDILDYQGTAATRTHTRLTATALDLKSVAFVQGVPHRSW